MRTVVVVMGPSTPFVVRPRRGNYARWGKPTPTLRISSRFYVAQTTSGALQIRPMGTYESRSASSDPTTAILYFGRRRQQSDSVEIFENTNRYMGMVLAPIPSQFAASGLPSIGFQSAKNRRWASSFLGSSALDLQVESHRLLLDLPVPNQTVSDLGMGTMVMDAEKVSRSNKVTPILQAGYYGTRLDLRRTAGNRV